jgi:putative ABC transport system ATP-binding protein
MNALNTDQDPTMHRMHRRVAIAVRGITKEFSAGGQTLRVLHGIDLQINAGELTYLVGESGSGKTTLISIMAGILSPNSGEVSVFGRELYAISATSLTSFRLANIGFIFQQYNLIPTLTAAENAAVPLIASGMKRHEAVARGQKMLDQLGIGNQGTKLPKQMSGGQQQRVAIARALVHSPRLVVCDEPTAALDAKSGRRVMDLLREVALAVDRSVVIVTHDSRVFDLADRIVVMEDGHIARDYRPSQESGSDAPFPH